MNPKRVKAIAKKEFKHLLRDIRLLLVLLILPIFLLITFGYAVNFNVENIKTAVLDYEKSDVSRRFVIGLGVTSYFDIVRHINDRGEIDNILDTKEAQCVIVIPRDMSEKFYSGEEAKIQFIIDGVDGNTANIILSYLNAAAMNYNFKLTAEVLESKGAGLRIPVKLEQRYWYNSDLNTTKFLIPGLIALILIITATVSVSLTLVREKERGTMEQVDVSPIKPQELLIGKIIPYLATALFNALFILIMGYILFGVGVEGSYLLLFLTTLLFLFASTTLGIFASVVADSQQVAFTIGTFVSLLPSLLLSGFIFQIESMPEIIQVITNITPAKFYLNALRAIMLRGVGVEAFWQDLIYLSIFCIVLLGMANIIYRKKQFAT